MIRKPVLSAERAALREAIARRETAKEVVRVASETADRGKTLLTSARSKLAAFGDVDAALLAAHAASFRNAAAVCGPAPNLTLPDDLVEKKKARDEAASAADAANVAHSDLVGEFAEAQSAWRKAESRVSESAAEVLVAETAASGRALTEIWNELWATIDALNALRGSLRVKLPSDVVRTLLSFEALDHRQFPGNRNAQLARASQHWRSYQAALCASADATAPDPIDGDGEASSAAIERVA
jgi:hypothetical protein